MLRVAVLFSGSATTVSALQQAIREQHLQGLEIVCGICSNDKSEAITRLVHEGIAQIYVVPSGADFDTRLLEVLASHQVDMLAQLGWLAKTPKAVIERYRGQIINQHPGPLDPGRPDFGGRFMYGLRVHIACLDFAYRTQHNTWTEATIHEVTEEYDKGGLIDTERLELGQDILSRDLAEPNLLRQAALELQQRLLKIEHQLVIRVFRKKLEQAQLLSFTRNEPLIASKDLRQLELSKELAIKLA